MVCVSGYTPNNFVNNTKAVSSLKCMRTPPLIKGPSYIQGEEYQITPEMRTPPLIRALYIYIYICIEIPLKWGACSLYYQDITCHN